MVALGRIGLIGLLGVAKLGGGIVLQHAG